MCACRYILFELFNSFWSSATKISSHATSSPPCSNGERRYLSVDTLYGDCKAVMRVGCLPNCGELFADFWCPQRLVDMKSMKVGSGHLPGGNLNIRAGSLCKGPPLIFWAWAASAHGHLLGILRYYLRTKVDMLRLSFLAVFHLSRLAVSCTNILLTFCILSH